MSFTEALSNGGMSPTFFLVYDDVQQRHNVRVMKELEDLDFSNGSTQNLKTNRQSVQGSIQKVREQLTPLFGGLDEFSS